MKITITVNISSLPRSIPKDNSHFAVSGSPAKVPAGPTTSPKPGPTLVIAVAALDILVTKSSPSNASPNASIANVSRKRKKKANTVSVMFSDMGSPL